MTNPQTEARAIIEKWTSEPEDHLLEALADLIATALAAKHREVRTMVDRFTFHGGHAVRVTESAGTITNETGPFVRYSDYAALEAENERLREDNERLIQLRDRDDAEYLAMKEDRNVWREKAERALAERAGGVKVLRDLLAYVDQNTCPHEATHRGGTIWTICDDCGKQWADDRGGFVPHEDAKPVATAREYLRTLTSEPAAPEERQVVGDEPFEVLPDGSYQRRTRPAEQAVMEAAHGVVEAFRFTAMKSEQLRAYHALIHALRGDAS